MNFIIKLLTTIFIFFNIHDGSLNSCLDKSYEQSLNYCNNCYYLHQSHHNSILCFDNCMERELQLLQDKCDEENNRF